MNFSSTWGAPNPRVRSSALPSDAVSSSSCCIRGRESGNRATSVSPRSKTRMASA